ncbi:TetR/AcrR family transcriptional regulator [Streptomyces sp. NPDC046915]|uniref:TetR/AcrR family transcriptional regulator n=1 Tax=Streptomyces sp. NPDC046915 TaxID=3155257 RepID=UPI00340F1461
MGHREALLEGAKQCLIEKGYARTTARDIVAASGANLASIGYHYGSKEALLNAALFEANAAWAEALDKALAQAPEGPAAPHERFESFWTAVIGLFAEHRRLWAVNIEAVTRMENSPEIRQALAEGLAEARSGLGETLFAPSEARTDVRDAHAVGNLCHALLIGVMTQWLIDPESAPSGPELSRALRVLAAAALPVPVVPVVPAVLEKDARNTRNRWGNHPANPAG